MKSGKGGTWPTLIETDKVNTKVVEMVTRRAGITICDVVRNAHRRSKKRQIKEADLLLQMLGIKPTEYIEPVPEVKSGVGLSPTECRRCLYPMVRDAKYRTDKESQVVHQGRGLCRGCYKIESNHRRLHLWPTIV